MATWQLPGTCVSERRMEALMRHGATTAAKHSFLSVRPPMASVTSRNGSSLRPRGILQLADLYGAEYVGELAVGMFEGSPQARLRVIYDTGSTDLWVLSDLCDKPPCTNEGRHTYNHRMSETFRAPEQPMQLATAYGSGEIHGMAGFDDVRIGPIEVREQAIGLIAEESGNAFESLPFDGVVGLGFPKLSNVRGLGDEPLLENLVRSENLPLPWFAFYLHKDPTEGGAVLWGGVDDRLYEGPLRWFPVVEEAYWTLDFMSFQIGDYSFDFTETTKTVQDFDGHVTVLRTPPMWQKPQLIVDSGTTFFTAPGYLFSAISSDSGFGVQQCSQLKDLPALVLGVRDDTGEKQEITIPASEYMVKTRKDDLCMPGVIRMDVPEDEQPMFLVGEVFMRHYFTVFSRGRGSEPSRVGLARAKQETSVSELLIDRPNE